MGDERERFTKPHAIAHAGAIDAGETCMFETVRDFERRLPSLGHGGETHRGFL
jgi:hypothetical protein